MQVELALFLFYISLLIYSFFFIPFYFNYVSILHTTVTSQGIELALVKVLFAHHLELKKYQLSPCFSLARCKSSLVMVNWFD